MEASRATQGEAAAWAASGLRQVVADYVTLTKPRVQLLLLLTTVTTMYVAGDPSLSLVALTVLGLSLQLFRVPAPVPSPAPAPDAGRAREPVAA